MKPAYDSMHINNMFKVSGTNVLVTGGAGGIGRMLTEAYVKNGARVYISSRNAKQCEAVAKELTAQGPGMCRIVWDG